MTWARLDDKFHGNRKIKRAWKASRAAVGLHVMAIAYSADYLTNGFVDEEFVEEKLAKSTERRAALDALTTSGLWLAVDGGWEINDYLDFNPSREEVDARREVKRRAGSLGGQAKWRKERITQRMRSKVAASLDASPGKQSETSCAYCNTRLTIDWSDPGRVRFLDEEGNPTPELDHVDSIANGGNHAAENLALACLACNRSKGGSSSTALAPANGLAGKRNAPVPVPIEEEASSSSSEIKDREGDRPEVDELCALLALQAGENSGRRPNVTQAWRRECRLLLDRDGRTVEQVRWIINWCQADQFWKGNVRSMPKLREQFDQLVVKAKAERVRPGGSASLDDSFLAQLNARNAA